MADNETPVDIPTKMTHKNASRKRMVDTENIEEVQRIQDGAVKTDRCWFELSPTIFQTRFLSLCLTRVIATVGGGVLKKLFLNYWISTWRSDY